MGVEVRFASAVLCTASCVSSPLFGPAWMRFSLFKGVFRTRPGAFQVRGL